MVDKKSRAKLAELLRHYTSGRITNDALYEIDIQLIDNGVKAINTAAWGLYDDFYEHKAIGNFYLDRDSKKEIGRWILFLQTNNEYQWKCLTFKDNFLGVITFGFYFKRFRSKINFDIWPFFTQTELEDALKKPNFLNPSNN